MRDFIRTLCELSVKYGKYRETGILEVLEKIWDRIWNYKKILKYKFKDKNYWTSNYISKIFKDLKIGFKVL